MGGGESQQSSCKPRVRETHSEDGVTRVLERGTTGLELEGVDDELKSKGVAVLGNGLLIGRIVPLVRSGNVGRRRREELSGEAVLGNEELGDLAASEEVRNDCTPEGAEEHTRASRPKPLR